jgi:hypothetical protein
MSVVRRFLAVLPVAALAAAASSASAAPVVQTQPCVPYVDNEKTMLVGVAGFVPGGLVQLHTTSAGAPAPRYLASGTLDGIGTFRDVVSPPLFSRTSANVETFNLIASDSTNPAAPLVAVTPFQVVRFGLTRTPTPKKPTSRVKVTARGFTPGKRVYAHFRFAGKTRRTVSLGIAKGVCGIAAKRMRALPTKARYGNWTAYIDQKKRFSAKTLPHVIDKFRIYRTVR